MVVFIVYVLRISLIVLVFKKVDICLRTFLRARARVCVVWFSTLFYYYIVIKFLIFYFRLVYRVFKMA